MQQAQWGKSLSGKVAVIAGDAYTIGHATASLFIREGARVFWIDDKADTKGRDRITIDGMEVPFFHADPTDAEQVKQAVLACGRLFPVVHILVNLAGRADKQRFEETSDQTWSEMLGRNITSAFYCSKYFLPLMKHAGDGSIIHQGSIDSFLGNPSVAAYSAAKGGTLPLTHVMAHDLAQYGIRVNAISTGGIRASGEARSVDNVRIAVTPAGRTGTADDVAKVALFLASDLSAYVNGANIVVDGGRTGITQGCYGD
jgi:NAD(P)-dependent dehydrogenase (short-subunit alcohol dehydrogenase family)